MEERRLFKEKVRLKRINIMHLFLDESSSEEHNKRETHAAAPRRGTGSRMDRHRCGAAHETIAGRRELIPVEQELHRSAKRHVEVKILEVRVQRRGKNHRAGTQKRSQLSIRPGKGLMCNQRSGRRAILTCKTRPRRTVS